MAYISVTDLKAYLGISGTGDDDLLLDLITSAQRMIDDHCQRVFEALTDSTRTVDATSADGLRLRIDDDLCSITSITNGDGTTVASTSYKTMPRNKSPYYAVDLLASKGITWNYTDDPEAAITIVGRWGYSVTPPADIVQACRRIAAYLYRQKDNSADLDRTIVAGNATILPSQLPADIEVLLAPYRRLV